MRVDDRKIRLDPTAGAQPLRADPRRGCLETSQERVDVDVLQLLGLLLIGNLVTVHATNAANRP